jgi:hypothetical protein
VNPQDPDALILLIARETGWPERDILKLPLQRVKTFLKLIRARDLSDRVVQLKLALLARTPFEEDAARQLARLVDEILPELQDLSGPPDPSAREQAALELMRQAGLNPVRIRKKDTGTPNA